jgi:hypothetical protein
LDVPFVFPSKLLHFAKLHRNAASPKSGLELLDLGLRVKESVVSGQLTNPVQPLINLLASVNDFTDIDVNRSEDD